MEAGKKRAGIYARIATLPQSQQLNPLDIQIIKCRLYCETQGYSVADEHIHQEVVSGTEFKKRIELVQLRDTAKCGEIDVVVVLTYDRIARNQIQVKAFLTELESFGVSVESVNEASPNAYSLVDQISYFTRTATHKKPLKPREQ